MRQLGAGVGKKCRLRLHVEDLPPGEDAHACCKTLDSLGGPLRSSLFYLHLGFEDEERGDKNRGQIVQALRSPAFESLPCLPVQHLGEPGMRCDLDTSPQPQRGWDLGA